MTQKNLDKFSILVAVIAVAVTISIMSLTGRLERGDGTEAPVQDTTLTAPADTFAVPADTLAPVPVADTLDSYI